MALAVASRYARALVDAVTARGAELDPRQVSEQLRRQGVQSILPARHQHQVVARSGEPTGESFPDPAGGPRHQRQRPAHGSASPSFSTSASLT